MTDDLNYLLANESQSRFVFCSFTRIRIHVVGLYRPSRRGIPNQGDLIEKPTMYFVPGVN